MKDVVVWFVEWGVVLVVIDVVFDFVLMEFYDFVSIFFCVNIFFVRCYILEIMCVMWLL